MERTLRVSLNMCPLHKISEKKTFNTKSRKNFTYQHNIPGLTKTCHVALFKSNFFLSHSDSILFSLSYFVFSILSLKLSFL